MSGNAPKIEALEKATPLQCVDRKITMPASLQGHYIYSIMSFIHSCTILWKFNKPALLPAHSLCIVVS